MSAATAAPCHRTEPGAGHGAGLCSCARPPGRTTALPIRPPVADGVDLARDVPAGHPGPPARRGPRARAPHGDRGLPPLRRHRRHRRARTARRPAADRLDAVCPRGPDGRRRDTAWLPRHRRRPRRRQDHPGRACPGGSGDDEQRMLLAVRQIVAAEPPLACGSGVKPGPVFVGDVGTAASVGPSPSWATRSTWPPD